MFSDYIDKAIRCRKTDEYRIEIDFQPTNVIVDTKKGVHNIEDCKCENYRSTGKYKYSCNCLQDYHLPQYLISHSSNKIELKFELLKEASYFEFEHVTLKVISLDLPYHNKLMTINQVLIKHLNVNISNIVIDYCTDHKYVLTWQQYWHTLCQTFNNISLDSADGYYLMLRILHFTNGQLITMFVDSFG